MDEQIEVIEQRKPEEVETVIEPVEGEKIKPEDDKGGPIEC